MSFSTGGGGGSASISGSTDVFLSNVTDDEVLSYDGSTSKWRNAVSSGLPDGGTTSQVITKATNIDQDAEWADTATLSNDLPLGWGNAQAGTANTASRADHVHPAPTSLGYPIDPDYYTNPLGNSVNTTTSIAVGRIRVSPLPVYRNFKILSVIPGLRDNTGTKNVQIALFASDQNSWKPTTRVGGVISAVINSNSFVSEPSYGAGLELAPGLYWAAILALDVAPTITTLEAKALANTYHVHGGVSGGTSTYYYNATAFGSMPGSLAGETPLLDTQSPFFFYFKPTLV